MISKSFPILASIALLIIASRSPVNAAAIGAARLVREAQPRVSERVSAQIVNRQNLNESNIIDSLLACLTNDVDRNCFGNNLQSGAFTTCAADAVSAEEAGFAALCFLELCKEASNETVQCLANHFVPPA